VKLDIKGGRHYTSLGLLMGFYSLLPRLGIAASVMKGARRDRPGAYEIRFPLCDASWLGYAARTVQQHSVRIDGDRLLVKIKRLEVERYDGPVCDIQTPAHDFVANNFTVHNRDDLVGSLLAAEDSHR
jgi:intein/homing endonuclease